MNRISISQDLFQRYLQDKKYTRQQIRYYAHWLDQYYHTGHRAFDSFLLCKGQDPRIIFICSQPEDNLSRYDITVLCSTDVPGEDPRFLPVLFWARYDQGALGVYVEIPENPGWQSLGVECFDDLDEVTQRYFLDMAQPVLCLFARVQSDALKCQRKILKVQRRAQEEPREPQERQEKKPVKKTPAARETPLVLSPGISFSVAREDSLPRQFQRHCEAWSVRGHYRHYKSGRTVYIRPYRKGKGRLKDTDYKSIPGSLYGTV